MKTNPNESVTPMFLRQVGVDDFRLATPKEIQEGTYLSCKMGLTKREHFAAMALRGLLAYYGSESATQDAYSVKDAVKIADALIAKLNESTESNK